MWHWNISVRIHANFNWLLTETQQVSLLCPMLFGWVDLTRARLSRSLSLIPKTSLNHLIRWAPQQTSQGEIPGSIHPWWVGQLFTLFPNIKSTAVVHLRCDCENRNIQYNAKSQLNCIIMTEEKHERRVLYHSLENTIAGNVIALGWQSIILYANASQTVYFHFLLRFSLSSLGKTLTSLGRSDANPVFRVTITLKIFLSLLLGLDYCYFKTNKLFFFFLLILEVVTIFKDPPSLKLGNGFVMHIRACWVRPLERL